MLTKTPIEQELLALCKNKLVNNEGLEHYEGRDLYLACLAKTAAQLDDSIFQDMSPELQKWLNDTSTAVMASESIVDFSGGVSTDIGKDLPPELIKLYNKKEGSYRRSPHYIAGFRMMRDHKMTNTDIARKLNVNMPTVSGWRKRWTERGLLATSTARAPGDRRKRPEKDAAIKMFQEGKDIPQVRAAFPNVPHSSIKSWKLQSGPIKGSEILDLSNEKKISQSLFDEPLKFVANYVTQEGINDQVHSLLPFVTRALKEVITDNNDWQQISKAFGESLKIEVVLHWNCVVKS